MWEELRRERGGFNWHFGGSDTGRCLATEVMTCISLIGVKRVHKATGEARAREFFLDLLQEYVQRGLTPSGAARRACGPMHGMTPQDGMFFGEALAYGYDLTGDERYLELGLRDLKRFYLYRVRTPLDTSSAKIAARTIRSYGHMMKLAHEKGLLDEYERSV